MNKSVLRVLTFLLCAHAANAGTLVVPSSSVNSASVLPVANEGAACTASPTSNVAITADYKHILSCQSGTWRRTTGRYWRDPVANQAALPSSGNEAGDVRLVLDIGRIFIWDGSAWKQLGG